MSDPEPTAANGNGLPADRQAAVEYGLTQYQTLAAERDSFAGQVRKLTTDIAAHKVVEEAQASRIAELESRVHSAMLVRDQAVAERAKYETLFVSLQAQLRAFEIPGAPLIREIETADVPAIGGA